MTLVAERIIESHPPDHRLDVLVVQARQGAAGARDDLLRHIRPLIYRWALMQTADADDADDVAQAVLLRVHTAVDAFDGRSTVTTWLYRITRNASIELYRKRSAWWKLRERWTGHLHAARARGPDALDAIVNQDTMLVVRKMMTSLSANQRAAFDLVDLQGYEPGEAAQMMEMNPATFRTHLLRARRTLRAAMMMEDA